MSTTCAIYVRISDDPTGARAGLERQLDECRAHAAGRGWTVGEVYEDDDRSAYSGKPCPAWERLLVDLAAGRVGALVAWHPDRLYRRIKDLSALVDAVGSRSVEIVPVSGGAVDLLTPTGRAVAMTICTWAGEFESAHKAERVALAAEARAHRGKCPRRRSLGYSATNEIVEREAEAIRAAVPILLDADRASLRAAARKLDELGIVTIETNRSYSTGLASLRSVLTGFKIAGIPSYRGEPLLDVEPNWKPIVTRAQREALRAVLLDDRRRTNAGRPARVALLSGIAVCSGPVRSATKEARKGSRDRVPTYRCAEHTHSNIRRAILDEQVVETVLVELACRDLTALAPAETDRDRMRALRDELDGVEQRQTEAAVLVAEGLLPPSRARSSLEGLRAAHDAAQGELAGLSARFGPRGVRRSPGGPGHRRRPRRQRRRDRRPVSRPGSRAPPRHRARSRGGRCRPCHQPRPRPPHPHPVPGDRRGDLATSHVGSEVRIAVGIARIESRTQTGGLRPLSPPG